MVTCVPTRTNRPCGLILKLRRWYPFSPYLLSNLYREDFGGGKVAQRDFTYNFGKPSALFPPLINSGIELRRVDRRVKSFGGHSVGVPPVPISNTVVKPHSADGTALEWVWESRTPPD